MVIPARNEAARLPRQLAALLDQSYDGRWEIIVVDNGSTDGTVEVVERYAEADSRLRSVHEPRPGLCHARNAGVLAARSDAVAICDADDLVADGWVGAMGNALREHHLVTGRQELDLLNPGWLAGSRGRRLSEGPPSFHGAFTFPAGNNLGVRKSLVERIGGFDQGYIGAEDVEFGFRAAAAGVATAFVPDAVVHYAYRRSPRALFRQGFSYGRHRPAIARRLASQGRRPSRIAGWKSWLWLAANAWRIVTPRGRALVAWVAGNRIGHVVGSVRHRTVLL